MKGRFFVSKSKNLSLPGTGFFIINQINKIMEELKQKAEEEKTEMTPEEFSKKYSASVVNRPGVVTQIINCHHRPPTSTQRVYFDIPEMQRAGWSKEKILEKIKETFREKGML